MNMSLFAEGEPGSTESDYCVGIFNQNGAVRTNCEIEPEKDKMSVVCEKVCEE